LKAGRRLPFVYSVKLEKFCTYTERERMSTSGWTLCRRLHDPADVECRRILDASASAENFGKMLQLLQAELAGARYVGIRDD
jgi:hypothetical protein